MRRPAEVELSHDGASQSKQNLLTVGVDSDTFEELAPPLLRTIFEVDRIPSPEAGLELVSLVPFAAIVIGHPLAGMGTRGFLDAVRAEGSASKNARIALLSSHKDDPSARSFLNEGVQLAISLQDDTRLREEQLCAMLGIQPRRDARVLVKLDVVLTDLKMDRFVAQTKDVSASGMFVITRKRHPVGSRATFEFNLSGERNPVRGSAEITRHTAPGERIQGMGFRFVSFDDESRARLIACLERHEL